MIKCPDCGCDSVKFMLQAEAGGIWTQNKYECPCGTYLYWNHRKNQYYVWRGSDKLYFTDEGDEDASR